MHNVSEDKSCPSRPTILFKPKGQHTATVIFFHGLGDSGAGWRSGIAEFAQKLPHVKFIVPTAPTIPVTLNGGAKCSAWFDIGMRGVTPQDMLNVFLTKPPMIESSAMDIMKIVAAEVKLGIPVDRILFGGFSMGGFLAAWLALHLKHTSAGVMMLSSMLFGPNHIKATDAGKKTPFLYFHGESDQRVPLFAANMSKAKLEEMGVSVEFKTFPMLDHAVDPHELNEAIQWVEKQLPAEVNLMTLTVLANSQEADFENIEAGAQRRIKVNSPIILRRLKRDDLNGSRGIVKDYNASSSRYTVEVDSTSMAMKAENIVQALKVTYKDSTSPVEVEDVNVEEGTYTLSGIGDVPAADVLVPTGSMLRAEGLQSETGSKLNGQYGEVLSFDKEKMRYVMSFGTQDTKLKAQNLFP